MKSIKNNHIFKVIMIGTLMVLLGITFSCSKEKKETEQPRVKPRKTQSMEPVIAKVEFEPPEPTSSDDIKANTTLEDPRMKPVKFQYQWFVNGEILSGIEGPHLEKQHYKKNDKVYCRVQAKRGIYESKVMKSKEIKIKNSIPRITLAPWDDVQLGDRFHYTIQARDPDNDPLTYRLVSPLDLGIKLDPNTGEIRWNTRDIPQPEPAEINRDSERGKGRSGEGLDESEISKAPIRTKKRKQPPSIVKIVFEVSDPDGGKAVSSIRLNLTREAGIPQ
jgi:hypothetical protein